jgi:hypothetical protein
MPNNSPNVEQRAKGSERMKKVNYEPETYKEENPVDTVWVRDGRGKMIQLEVHDDVDDD